MALRSISLCAGVGGIDLALRPYARTVCYVEREAYAAAVLVARMEDEQLDPAPIWSDLKTFDATAWRGTVDLVTGGYPCQPFSVAGKRAGADDPRHLWPDVLRVLEGSGAALAFFENVRGHVSSGLREVLEDLARAGFNAEWDVFSAEEEGAPHRRERLFMFAYASGVDLRQQSRRGERAGREGPALVGGNGEGEPVADAKGQGLEVRLQPAKQTEPRPPRSRWWATEPNVGRGLDGLAAGLDANMWGPGWEDGLPRVASVVPNRVDRLRACGNGVVPATARRAWLELTERAGASG